MNGHSGQPLNGGIESKTSKSEGKRAKQAAPRANYVPSALPTALRRMVDMIVTASHRLS